MKGGFKNKQLVKKNKNVKINILITLTDAHTIKSFKKTLNFFIFHKKTKAQYI